MRADKSQQRLGAHVDLWVVLCAALLTLCLYLMLFTYVFIYVFIDLLDYYWFCFLFVFLISVKHILYHRIVLLILALLLVAAWATHFPPCGTIKLISLLI